MSASFVPLDVPPFADRKIMSARPSFSSSPGCRAFLFDDNDFGFAIVYFSFCDLIFICQIFLCFSFTIIKDLRMEGQNVRLDLLSFFVCVFDTYYCGICMLIGIQALVRLFNSSRLRISRCL